MDKLKNLLKSDTPTGEEQSATTGTSSRLAGQGSHFPGRDESTNVGNTSASSAGTGRTGALDNTSSAYTAGQSERYSGAGDSRSGVPDYSVSSAAFPKTESSRDGSGTAAIGQTGTYTSSHLSKGDPTSSVVDPTSSDPMTYQKPEAGAHAGSGTSSGAAARAAGLAFSQSGERKKSDLAGHENPYRTTSLDPRVDGLSKSSATTASPTAPTSSSTTSRAATGAGSGISGTGLGTGLAGGSRTHDNVAAPSSLTTTADPTTRSTEYTSSTQSRGLDSATPLSSSQPTTTTSGTTSTTADDSQQSMFGRALGAVGLGGLAESFGAGTATGRDSSAVADTPNQPTTTTGIESYTAPTQQGPPTSHHRKESIPTTAYPSATFDSPRAINAPIGGAGSPIVHGDRTSHSGRDVTTGVAAGGAAVGATSVGRHDYEQSRSLRENISGEPHSSAPALKESGDTTATTGVDSSRYDQAHSLRQNISGQPSTGYSSTGQTSTGRTSTGDTSVGGLAYTHHLTTVGDDTTHQPPSAGTYVPGKFSESTSTSTSTAPVVGRADERDYTTRNTALGAGAGAAAVGTGAYGAHEYSKREAEKAETEAAKERAAHEKELTKQRAAQENEAEKRHHAEEKAAAKEERHHQKELEKEEKHHQKEVEKEEKHHQKEVEKEEKYRQKELEKEQQREAEIVALKERRQHEKEEARLAKEREEEAELRRNSQQRERLLGSTGTEGYDEKREKEKKPSIFKRIFKRRKNKETGEEEDYSSDEEHSPAQSKTAAYGGHSTHDNQTGAHRPVSTSTSGHTAPTAAGAAYGSAVVGVGHSALDEQTGLHPIKGDSTYDRSTTSAPATGATTGYTTSSTGQHQNLAPSTLESTGVRSAQPSTAVTGVPATSGHHDQSHATSTLGSTGTTSHQATEAITGLPYDPSKDPDAARRLSSHHHGSNPVHNVEGTTASNPVHNVESTTGSTTDSNINTNFTMGEIGETRR